MKRTKYIHLVITVIVSMSIIFVSGCGQSSNHNTDNSGNETNAETSQVLSLEDKELLASYEGDTVPAFVKKSGDRWFVIYQKYGENDYAFASGDSPDTNDVKYEGSGEIWKLSADGEIAAWAERIDIGVNINVYDATKDEVETIAVLPELPHEPQQTFAQVKDGKVYYCLIDYEAKEKCLMCYEVANKKGSILATETNYEISFLSMKGNTLMYESIGENGETLLTLYDTTSGETEQISLPEYVRYIWNADIEGDAVALYYYDNTEGNNAWNQTDNIAVFERGKTDFTPIFSFPTSDTGASWYAYNDDIELFGDNVLWIYQQNVSGDILDHYHMTVYNYKTNDYIEEPATFDYMTDGEDLYWLSWDDNVNKVDIYKKK